MSRARCIMVHKSTAGEHQASAVAIMLRCRLLRDLLGHSGDGMFRPLSPNSSHRANCMLLTIVSSLFNSSGQLLVPLPADSWNRKNQLWSTTQTLLKAWSQWGIEGGGRRGRRRKDQNLYSVHKSLDSGYPILDKPKCWFTNLSLS